MPKDAPTAGMDAALDYYTDADVQYVCSAAPANFAGIAAVALASIAMDPGDFALSNGTPNGRKFTVAEKIGALVTDDGTPTHVVLANTGDSTIRYQTVCTVDPAVPLVTGSLVNFPEWTGTILEPS